MKSKTLRGYLCSAAGLVALAAAGQAAAQQASSVDEVVVTGSRVNRQGFVSPSPTSVLGQAEIQMRAPTNAVALINELPSFRPSNTTTARPGFAGSGPVSADLRGLGNRRTLTLFDNKRFVPASSNGTVDLNQIPTNMIERAEVVSGGASAAFGADALSGVVNFITKKHFEGLQGDFGWGEAEAGDYQNWQMSLTAGGAFNEGKGHLVMGGEYLHSGIIKDVYARKWGAQETGTLTFPTGTARGDQPARIVAQHVGNNIQGGFGGVIIGVNADTNAANGVDVLRGIAFNPDGSRRPWNYGDPGAFGNASGIFGNNGVNAGYYGETAVRGITLVPRVDRWAFMTNFEYQILPNVTFSASANFARADNYIETASRRDSGIISSVSPTTGIKSVDYILIRRNNAFLPADIAQIMDRNNITQFYMGRVQWDLGVSPGGNTTTVERGVAALNGSFLNDKWKWDVSYGNGRNKFYEYRTNQSIESRWHDATEAVRNAAGQVVCLSNATALVNPGCTPFNVFGYNRTPDLAAAKKYLTGDRIVDSLAKQQVAEANLSGEPFSTWAGPVTVAAGVAWRKESVEQRSDAISQADDFDNQNPKPYAGGVTVKEIYGETAIPLLKDQRFFKSVDFNGAIRRTDYSTSGAVTTWKLGLTWSVNDDIRFRGAFSRDIRAPNLLELYGTISSPGSLLNPFNNTTTPTLVTTVASNPKLGPERSNQFTAGVVLEPRFIPRFRMSFDFYNIDIKGAIANFPNATIAQNCGFEVRDTGKPGLFCSFLDSNGQYNTNFVIYGIQSIPFNLLKQTAQGLDIEAQYSFPLFGGNVDLRAFGTYLADMTLYDLTGKKTQYAGSIAYIVNGMGGSPDWTGTLNTTYSYKKARVLLQSRFLSDAKIDPTLIGPDDKDYKPSNPQSININKIKARAYFNLSATYDLNPWGRKVQLYGRIDNLLDKDPPWQISGPGVNGMFYDSIGRQYRVGVRFTL